MGFFSWETQDSNESIANHYSDRSVFTVYMHDQLGNTWQEDKYEGYGVFGGKDYYELLAEMNGLKTREEGIELAYSDPAKPCLFPNLTRCRDWKYKNQPPENCEFQGYFYWDGEDEDEDCYGFAS